jgi:putative FmdB family regulatory protein
MPTYEYECDSCAHRFEAVQKMADAPLSECPECGEHVRRVLSANIGIAFKGSGFYANDTKKTQEKKEEKPVEKKESAPACPAACPSCPAAAAT